MTAQDDRGRLTIHEANGPPPPAHLSRTSRATWRAVVRQWELDPTALLVLEGGLTSWDLYLRARRELADSPGVTLVGGQNVARQAPAVKTMLDALKEARLAFAQLHLQLPPTEAQLWAKHARGLERKHERRHG